MSVLFNFKIFKSICYLFDNHFIISNLGLNLKSSLLSPFMLQIDLNVWQSCSHLCVVSVLPANKGLTSSIKTQPLYWYSWPVIIDQLANLYDQLLSRNYVSKFSGVKLNPPSNITFFNYRHHYDTRSRNNIDNQWFLLTCQC